MSHPKTRFGVNGCTIMPHGLISLALGFQHRPQVAMSFRIVRAGLQSLAKCTLSVAVSLLAYQKNTIIVVTLWKVRIDFDRGLIRVLGFVASPGPGIKRNQVCVRLSEPRILLHSLLMFGDGAVDLAQVLQLYPLHEVCESCIIE